MIYVLKKKERFLVVFSHDNVQQMGTPKVGISTTSNDI